jgi:RNA polymerase sigma-70 factor, ECF subfamily
MNNEIDERSLIEGLLKNDRDSLVAVYDAYASAAYGLALRVLGTAAEAEDVVQESFLALWRQAERLDASRGLRSYLLAIVHHRAVDKVRRRGRRPELALDEEAPFVAPEEDPADAAARLDEAQQVRAALGSLPPDQRETVEMVYFKGLTINETADRMSVPLGTVKSRLRLAMARLRRELDPS